MGKSDRVALQNLPRSRALMVHGAAAIHQVTLLIERPASFRTAALFGIERILEDEKLYLDLLLKRYDSVHWKASGYVHIALQADDVIMVKDCQKYLAVVAQRSISKPEALLLGLIRMARPEFGWHINMTALDAETLANEISLT